MWLYEKRLQYPVNVRKPDAKTAKIVIAQLGGPNGELGAALHTLGVYPTNSAGIPFSADTFQSVGDPISDLTEDMAAEQKARTTYDNILALSKNEDVNKVIRFLREREIVHYQRFAEGLEYVKSQLNKKNYYAYNPSFTSSKREQTCE